MQRDPEEKKMAEDAEEAPGQINDYGSNGNGDKMRRSLGEYVDQAKAKIEDGRVQAATGIERAATTVRERSTDAAEASKQRGYKVADGMENAAGYMQSHRTEEIAGDVWGNMKAHPARMAMIALVSGLLMGRAIR